MALSSTLTLPINIANSPGGIEFHLNITHHLLTHLVALSSTLTLPTNIANSPDGIEFHLSLGVRRHFENDGEMWELHGDPANLEDEQEWNVVDEPGVVICVFVTH